MPEKIHEDCICFNISKASRKINQIYDKALRPANINAKQFSILSVLSSYDTAVYGQGLHITALANELGMERTTCTRNLSILGKHGLVELSASTGDGRIRTIKITRKGSDTLKKAKEFWEELNNRKAASLTGEAPDLLYLFEMLEELSVSNDKEMSEFMTKHKLN